jgi:hypothetical protein
MIVKFLASAVIAVGMVSLVPGVASAHHCQPVTTWCHPS